LSGDEAFPRALAMMDKRKARWLLKQVAFCRVNVTALGEEKGDDQD
jgi:hypothetical protein